MALEWRHTTTEGTDTMKIRFNAPTLEMPFYTDVKVMIKGKWFKVMIEPQDGRERAPALFATSEEMTRGCKKVVKNG